MLGAMLTLGSAAALHAQEVTWEDIGPVEGVAERLTLVVGPTASTDTVFVAGGSTDLRRYPPGGPWSEALHGPALPAVDFVVTKEGYYLAESIPMDRSTDGGRTWQRGVYDSNQISCFLQTTLPVFAGAVVACRRIAALLRSDDGGATWATLPITPVSGEGTGSLWDLAEVPVSAALPAGRLLAATSLGVVYSDDGAETWRTSDLWRLGEVWILARQNDPTHPFGGTVYASADAAIVESPPALWASEDGGATWAQRIVFDMPSYGYEGPYPPASVAAGDDGSVWMGLNQL
ncbi:MAG: sialidase family protein, partial [Bacteroidota bacterium]